MAAAGGIVAIHNSGGEREMTIDLADRAGVTFADIAAQTRRRLAARLDPGLAAENPLDAWGTGENFVALFADCFTDLLADPQAALGLFCVDLRDDYYLHAGFAEAARTAAASTDKPVAIVTSYTQVRHDRIALALTEAGVPVLDGSANGLAAARGALAWRDFFARTEDLPPPAPDLRPGARAWPMARRSPRRRCSICWTPAGFRPRRVRWPPPRRRRLPPRCGWGFPWC